MAYTYKISFDGSVYQNINVPMIESVGNWVTNTFIWREKLSEVKINKANNPAIYTQLETWFTDATKFTTRIYIQVLKNGVQESLHWFGIKWGEIDQDKTFYKVSPEIYDDYANKLLPYLKSIEDSTFINDAVIELVNQATTNYDYLEDWGRTNLGDFIKDKIDNVSVISGSDVVSSILLGDAYEDTSTVTTTYGMLIDYVTSTYSVFKYAVVNFDNKTWNEMTIESIFEMLRVFQIYPFFDSNGKLRFEHLKFFEDKLIDNAVSISLEQVDDNFKYEDSQLIVYEELSLQTEEAETDEDWGKLPITYSGIRNRIDSTEQIYSLTNWFTNASYFNTNYADFTNYFVIFAGFQNHVMNWSNVDMLTFTAANHYLTFTGGNANECGSKNFKSYNTGFTLIANVVSITGSLEVSVYSRATGINSDVITWTTTGAKSETLTLIDGNKSDNYLKLQWSGGPGNSFEGWLNLYNTPGGVFINPWAVGSASTTNVMNGPFSKANILNSYWTYGRAAKAGTMNGSAKTFDSTAYNLNRGTLKKYYATVPNPLFGLNDGTRIGRIKSWKRVIDTGYFELDLSYQEDT